MASEWSSRPLRDCAKWYSGGTPSKSNQAYWNGSIPWISAKSLKEFFVRESEDKVTESGAENGTRLVPENSILFIVRGMSLKSEFRMGITTKPVTFNQDLKALVAHEDINPKFLAYAIKGREKEILGLVGEAGHGTGVLPTDRIEGLEIFLPPEDEQSAIAHVLGTLDDKIELNRKQNETLEAMARALFKAWFVDFEPVRAKMEGHWQRGQSLPGLPAHLYDLYPDRLVESEIGEIPEGWEVSTLGKVSSYLSRGISPKYIDAGGVLVLNQKCIRGFAIDFNKGRRHDVTQRGVDGRALEVGDVLVNSTGVGTLGRVAQVRRLAEQTVVDSHVTVVRSVARINPAYLCGFMYMKQPEIEAMGEGSTGQTELSRSKLGAMEILIPSISVLQEYAKLVGAMAESQAQNQDSSDALVSLRDTLLPKLISGELRVSSLNEDATP